MHALQIKLASIMLASLDLENFQGHCRIEPRYQLDVTPCGTVHILVFVSKERVTKACGTPTGRDEPLHQPLCSTVGRECFSGSFLFRNGAAVFLALVVTRASLCAGHKGSRSAFEVDRQDWYSSSQSVLAPRTPN